MKRKTKIVLFSIVAVIVVITGGIAGGKYYMDKKEEQQHAEMVAFVKKHHKVIENDLRESDKNSFIKSITIDYDSVEQNPMSGMNVNGYVNDNKKLKFYSGLDIIWVEDKKKIETGGTDLSRKLAIALGDE